jgi:glycerol-3-phosphate dehydrogenase
MVNIKADVAVIGAGVVGCAIARRHLMVHPRDRVIVLEKLADAGLETSGLNSGVLHSGLHQKPGWLKSHLVRRGSTLAVEYAERHGIPVKKTGMIVAVPEHPLRRGLWREMGGLLSLLRRAQHQRVGLRFLTRSALKKLEPNMAAAGGIFVPNVWVVEPREFVVALHEDARSRGAEFLFGNPVLSIERDVCMYRLYTPEHTIEARAVVNAAGLYADDIAAMAGFGGYAIYPWRGEYYEIVGGKSASGDHLIYPAMPKKSPSKGIHFGPRLDGRLFIGPNARPVPSKNWYSEDPTPKEVFLEAARMFFPSLEADDLMWVQAGIRPKLTPGAEESDFIIRPDRIFPLFINCIGIESPGFASSMAIAEYIGPWLAAHA